MGTIDHSIPYRTEDLEVRTDALLGEWKHAYQQQFAAEEGISDELVSEIELQGIVAESYDHLLSLLQSYAHQASITGDNELWDQQLRVFEVVDAGLAEEDWPATPQTIEEQYRVLVQMQQTRTLNEQQLYALRRYQKDGSFALNRQLRGMPTLGNVYVGRTVMESIFAQAAIALPTDIWLTRAIYHEPGTFDAEALFAKCRQEGVFHDGAYLSTSATPLTHTYTGSHQIHILARAGSKGVAVDAYTGQPGYTHENEVLLPAGSRMNVLAGDQNNNHLYVEYR